jgi:hypothetical protein
MCRKAIVLRLAEASISNYGMDIDKKISFWQAKAANQR